MNILIVYPFLLHTRVAHGSGVRLLRLVRGLSARGHGVYVLSLAETDPEPYAAAIAPLEGICREIRVIPRPKLTPFLKALRFVSPSIPPHPRNILDPIAQAYVRELTASGHIDIVYLVFTWLGEYVKSIDRTRCSVILDADDLDTRRYRLMLYGEKNPWHWLHALITWQRGRQYEYRILESVDQVVAITLEEKEFIHQLNPRAQVNVIPLMIPVQEYAPLPETEEDDALAFVGSFVHPPNCEAVTWFCRQVLPLIVARIPLVHFYIVGWQSQAFVGHLASRSVKVVDSVEDIRPWLAKAAVVVNPVLSGGGARMKNLEALAVGRPLVTTALGAEGLMEPPGSGYLVADDARSFARTVVALLENRELRHQLGESGRRFVARAHDTRVVIARLENLLQVATTARIGS